jgi:hypothetical protein
MRLRIGVAVTEEWAEEALPALEAGGLHLVASAAVPGSDGEYVECDFDLVGAGLSPDALHGLIARVRAIVDRSCAPALDIRFIAESRARARLSCPPPRDGL